MEPKVLVAYATRNGSTEEVARTVGAVFGRHHVAADVRPAADVGSIAPYTAVVICVPLYMGRLLKEVRRFLSRNRSALEPLPVALFVSGPVQNQEKDWTGARTQLDKELRNFPWLSPVAQLVVGGKFDPSNLGFPFNLIPMFRKMSPTDVRDWGTIRKAAGALAEQFRAGKGAGEDTSDGSRQAANF